MEDVGIFHGNLVCLVDSGYILWSFWYTLSSVGISFTFWNVLPRKSGNPGPSASLQSRNPFNSGGRALLGHAH
jgi:hypothetical protein